MSNESPSTEIVTPPSDVAESDTSVAVASKKRWPIFVAVAIFVVMIIMVSVVSFVLLQKEDVKQESTPAPLTATTTPVATLPPNTNPFATMVAERHYQSNVTDIQFAWNAAWTPLHVGNAFPYVPPLTEQFSFLLQHTSEECIIAYLDTDSPIVAGSAVDTSFADRVYGKEQFDKRWYVPATSPIEFSWDVRQPLPYEFQVTTNDFGSFVLWNPFGAEVADQCDADFNAFLPSVNYYFAPTTLTATSSGFIGLAFNNTEQSRHRHITFTDWSGEKYSLIDVTQVLNELSDIFVRGSKLYMLNTKSSVLVMDVMSKEISTLPLPLPDESMMVKSIYVKGDHLYYTVIPQTEEFCTDGYGTCYGQLYQYDFESTQVTLLTPKIYSIISRVSDDAVFGTSSNGDAGCGHYQIDRFGFDGEYATVFDKVVCEAEYTDFDREYKAWEDSLKGVPEVTNTAMLMNGILETGGNNERLHSRFIFAD